MKKEVYLAEVQQEADGIIHYFIIGYFLAGLLLATVYDTWLLALGVGGLNVTLYLLVRSLTRRLYLRRQIVSLIFAFYMLQFIGQMHGMYEMHFIFFINIAILIIYQDWRLMLPYTIFSILHHVFFFYLQWNGFEEAGTYFINDVEVTVLVLAFHFGLAAAMAVLCGWWAYRLNRTSRENYINRKAQQQQLDTIGKNLHFMDEIMQGNYHAEVPVDKQDGVGRSLLKLRDILKTNEEEENQRSWVTQGLNLFSQLLRDHNKQTEDFYQQLISQLVRYVGANQGAIFVLSEAQPPSLQLKACYAYGKIKHIKSEIAPGEGMLGQCFLEKELVYLSEIPADYVKITSGLGQALPRYLLMLPLSLHEEVVGMLEIASFQPIKNYQQDFLKQLSEHIASALIGMRTRERTQSLLEDAELQKEQLRAQEEEMRQNMEELMATQEELQRKERAYLQQIDELREKMAAYEKEQTLS
ncbi:MAG: GAF domain-containing protein [Cyclobacteriaceae bacterium]